jgi:transposase
LAAPYSADLKPIEQVFAKLKLLLDKAAERTVEDRRAHDKGPAAGIRSNLNIWQVSVARIGH